MCADSFSDWEASRAVFVKGFVLKGITRQNKLSAKAGIDKSKRKRFDSPLHRYGYLRTGQLLLTTMMRGRDLYKSRVRISAPKQDFFFHMVAKKAGRTQLKQREYLLFFVTGSSGVLLTPSNRPFLSTYVRWSTCLSNFEDTRIFGFIHAVVGQ